MGAISGNPHWQVETSIEFTGQGEREGANFIYEVKPPLSDFENRALIVTGLMLGASVEGGEIDPNGESIIMPIAMENYENGEPVSSILKVSGKSDPIKRFRDLERMSGALTVMRNGPVDITFDKEIKAEAR